MLTVAEGARDGCYHEAMSAIAMIEEGASRQETPLAGPATASLSPLDKDADGGFREASQMWPTTPVWGRFRSRIGALSDGALRAGGAAGSWRRKTSGTHLHGVAARGRPKGTMTGVEETPEATAHSAKTALGGRTE